MAGSDLDYIAREAQLPFAGERDSPFGHVVTATLEEIRYAEFLRQRLREAFQMRASATGTPWCVGAD